MNNPFEAQVEGNDTDATEATKRRDYNYFIFTGATAVKSKRDVQKWLKENDATEVTIVKGYEVETSQQIVIH